MESFIFRKSRLSFFIPREAIDREHSIHFGGCGKEFGVTNAAGARTSYYSKRVDVFSYLLLF